MRSLRSWVRLVAWSVSIVALLVALTGCKRGAMSGEGGGGGSGTGGSMTTGTGGDAASTDEKAATDAGGDSASVLGQTLAVADSIFSFDPTIDTTKTAAQNAAAIQANATANLGGCGSATLAATTVTIDFGAAPGCTLSNGVTASGVVTVLVTKSGSQVSLALTFANLVVNSKDVSGTATFTTSNGTTFTVVLNLTSGGKTNTANLTVSGTNGAFTIDGTASTKADVGTTTYTFSGVTWKAGDCYPSAGSMTIQKGIIKITVTFSATTPTTGSASVTSGKKMYSTTLPAYGSCPSG